MQHNNYPYPFNILHKTHPNLITSRHAQLGLQLLGLISCDVLFAEAFNSIQFNMPEQLLSLHKDSFLYVLFKCVTINVFQFERKINFQIRTSKQKLPNRNFKIESSKSELQLPNRNFKQKLRNRNFKIEASKQKLQNRNLKIESSKQEKNKLRKRSFQIKTTKQELHKIGQNVDLRL